MDRYILVLGEDGDVSVDKVIYWLKYLYGVEVVRINNKDVVTSVNIKSDSESNIAFELIVNNSIKVNSGNIVAYWYRRGGLKNIRIKPIARVNYSKLYETIDKYFLDEWEDIANLIHHVLRNGSIPNLDTFLNVETNKLVNIELAKQVGLDVPDSLISNDINQIKSFIEKHNKVITKPTRSANAVYREDKNVFSLSQYTNIISKEDVDIIASKHKLFQPTLFQKYVEKEFEIRTFYLKGETYSMAIFSQSNSKTKIDFRNYDHDMPNRVVPYQLPKDINRCLKKLMNILEYDTGSIDFIYSNEAYYFLEVNTFGQFDWLSSSCQYFIERKIASTVLNNYVI